MDKTTAAYPNSEARRVIVLLTAISRVSRRMADKMALLEKLRAERMDAKHGQ